MRIGLTGIFVDDQDRAERFYTEVLGLQIKTNAAYGPGERWLTVVSPEDPDGVDLVLHLTEWEEFRHASPAALAAVVRSRNIVDGRNCLDPLVWRSAGWEYRAMGRP